MATVDFEIIIGFVCPDCGKEVSTSAPFEPIWYGENTATPEVQGLMIECPHCGEKLKGRAWATPSAASVEFIDYPETHIETKPPTVRDVYDDWDDYDDVPLDPLAVLSASLTDAGELLNEMGRDRYLLNKLVFTNFITSFEVFLSDSFINRVLGSERALKRLIERDQELRALRFSLANIAAAPDLIKDAVRARLRSVTWHRMKIVSALYNKAFEVDVLGIFGSDAPTIFKAIEYRHICVHRNGTDKDGKDLDVFTREYVSMIAGVVYRAASDIERTFKEMDAIAFFGAPSPSEEPR